MIAQVSNALPLLCNASNIPYLLSSNHPRSHKNITSNDPLPPCQQLPSSPKSLPSSQAMPIRTHYPQHVQPPLSALVSPPHPVVVLLSRSMPMPGQCLTAAVTTSQPRPPTPTMVSHHLSTTSIHLLPVSPVLPLLTHMSIPTLYPPAP